MARWTIAKDPDRMCLVSSSKKITHGNNSISVEDAGGTIFKKSNSVKTAAINGVSQPSQAEVVHHAPQPVAPPAPPQPAAPQPASPPKQALENAPKRATNIFSTSVEVDENFKPPSFPKPNSAIKFIDDALKDNFVFQNLNQKTRRLMIDAMQREDVPAGTNIITQGDIGDYFYVVEAGDVDFIVGGNTVGSTGRGAAFGELALLCTLRHNCRTLYFFVAHALFSSV
jgi:hypothetical protein